MWKWRSLVSPWQQGSVHLITACESAQISATPMRVLTSPLLSSRATAPCPKCENAKAFFLQIQIRSADEPSESCLRKREGWSMCEKAVAAFVIVAAELTGGCFGGLRGPAVTTFYRCTERTCGHQVSPSASIPDECRRALRCAELS